MRLILKKLALTGSALFLSTALNGMEIASDVIQSCVTSHICIKTGQLIHELGHVAVAKMLYGNIDWRFTQFSLSPFKGMRVFIDAQPGGIKDALVTLEGPLSALLTGYLLLKCNNVFYEHQYKKRSFKKAVKKGFKKPLFNKNQNPGIQAGAFCSMLSCATDLLSINFNTTKFFHIDKTMDGYGVLKALDLVK